MSGAPGRLAAGERRATILTAGTACFADRGYSGTTTARVAAAASVNEALVFRHFGSKQHLFIACVDAAWARLQERCDELFREEPVERHWRMPGRAFLELVRGDGDIARMWMRALVETTGIAEIDEHLARLMTQVHEFVAAAVGRSARAGGLVRGRDPQVEAWTIIALGLLGASLGTRGLVDEDSFEAVLATHRAWITGDAT